MGLPEDIYAAVDSCQTNKEIWLRVEQMMKGESIESYHHRFSKLINDFSREKHFPEKIASNLKFLNNLQSEWNRSVTVVDQTKNLYEVDYTQLYDFLKFNQDEGVQNVVQNLGVQNVGNQNGLIVVPGIAPLIANQNANYNGNGNVVVAQAEGNANRNNGNQIRCYNYKGIGHLARNCTVRPKRRDYAYLQTHLLIAQKEEAGIQLQAEEFDLMAAAGDIDEIKDVNANCVLMANLQQASTSGIQIGKAPVYDSDGTSEFLGTVRFGNDHIASILGYGDLQWGNILITRQGKIKKASHPPKPVPNSKQRSKDEAPKVIKTFLKKINVLLQAPVIILAKEKDCWALMAEVARSLKKDFRGKLEVEAAMVEEKVGGVENKSLVGSKFMASGEECLDGWVGAGRGEVKGGGVVFRVSNILLSVIPEDVMGESGG
ncbi:uncharacterized mitochondrial protein-like protein [Tanacetum coccineum]